MDNFGRDPYDVKQAWDNILVQRKPSTKDIDNIYQTLIKSYEDTIKNSTLTDAQKELYKSITTMYAKLWQESSKAQIQMGKANILPPRANWYSAMRKGDFFVELEFGPSVIHRQHFRTKLQAEKFIEQFQKTKNKQGVTVSGVQKKVQEQESEIGRAHV